LAIDDSLVISWVGTCAYPTSWSSQPNHPSSHPPLICHMIVPQSALSPIPVHFELYSCTSDWKPSQKLSLHSVLCLSTQGYPVLALQAGGSSNLHHHSSISIIHQLLYIRFPRFLWSTRYRYYFPFRFLLPSRHVLFIFYF
jgi:hypothetical protein